MLAPPSLFLTNSFLTNSRPMSGFVPGLGLVMPTATQTATSAQRQTAHQPVQFEIQVAPVVYKYLAHHYPVKPFLIQGGGNKAFNPYSEFLNNGLERYRYLDAERPASFAKLTARLPVAVSACKDRYGFGSQLTPAKIWSFNEFVRRSFMRQLVADAQLRASYGDKVQTSITNFLRRYTITEDELSLEVAMRYYHRALKLGERAHV